MRHAEEDLPPSSLRGRLCEVFFSALTTEMIDALMRRLGDKAELDDPIFGAASGLDPLRARLAEWSSFISDRDGQYDRTVTLVGGDRDVTEGKIEMRDRALPIALLMERRKEREVALRVYCGTSALGVPAKGPTVVGAVATAVPSFTADLLAALGKRDAVGAAACFEEDSSVRDALGAEHDRDAAARLLTKSMVVHGVADNGQSCAVEVAFGDSNRMGLLVLQRGDSGLVRSLRIYSEV